MAESRSLAARLIGASPEEIGLTVNTGYGLSLAARALPLKRGDIVLASDKEFPANVYPWMGLKDIGVTLELAPTTPEGWPDEERLLERLADPRVRVLAVSLVQFSNGYTVDLARLSDATRAAGTYLVVDAIQGLGQIPLDVGEVPVDILACGAQKWLLSPWGSGFVYVRRELIRDLHPAITGWMAFEGTDDFSRLTQYDDTLRADARRFELITLPYQDFAGMNASLDLLLSVGIHTHRCPPASAARACPGLVASKWSPGSLAGRRPGIRHTLSGTGLTCRPRFVRSRQPRSSAACGRVRFA